VAFLSLTYAVFQMSLRSKLS